ncbi:kinase [Sphingobium lactosutens]|mgnify:CR=1 FL=1|uniref:kinase n=1 Tax=Sphingobium lactosutens TaxID=522773 RepID=UPI0015BBCC1F|nr:kinase [Sphingobium lactosutens]NWK98360.1 kinase [Sphingobium lactosutens]
MTPSLERIAAATRDWLAGASRPLILGLCGAQGSGKSTLAAGLQALMEQDGRRTAILSLDDLYLGRAVRARLADEVHPLFRTRGVPGTHDVARGIALCEAVKAGDPVLLPRFDKGQDEPFSEGEAIAGSIDLLIFEGWCVGARPQPEADLVAPVNVLERDEDPDGIWRRHVNRRLYGPYAELFGWIDRLILLAAPDFAVVRSWRGQQEEALRAEQGEAANRAMDAAQLDRFVQHYERLTRHILTEMPGRADLTLSLDSDRQLRTIA